MHVGFTGTRQGMSVEQRRQLVEVLLGMGTVVLHHGDCVGADAQAHAIARILGLSVHLHPPSDPVYRAYCKGAIAEDTPLPYLHRNVRIVAESELLIVAPSQPHEVMRSGTWATYREAKRRGVQTLVIWRDRGRAQSD